MKQLLRLFVLLAVCGFGNLSAQERSNAVKEKLLFTLTPKNGFFVGDDALAYLDGKIQSYYPSNKKDPDGYVYFTYYEDGDTQHEHVRLWTKTKGTKKMRAEFDIETTCLPDSNDFFFSLLMDDGGYKPLGRPVTVSGAKRQVIKVPFSTDKNGGALVRMYATKENVDKCFYILRRIDVFQLD